MSPGLLAAAVPAVGAYVVVLVLLARILQRDAEVLAGLHAVTCISCGAEWGQPHTSTCEFER